MMPEGLIATVSIREMVSLLDFLEQLGAQTNRGIQKMGGQRGVGLTGRTGSFEIPQATPLETQFDKAWRMGDKRPPFCL